MSKRLTTEEFIERIKAIHGDKYDYSKIVYVKSKQKVEVVCKKHGSFFIRPNDLLSGHGCPQCAMDKSKNSRRYTLEEFINKSNSIHNNKYDYSNVEYINNKTKVKIICPIHGEFLQLPEDHLRGRGCKKCADLSLAKDKNTFIEEARKIHNDLYDYSKVNYINSYTPISIICKKHGEFLQSPSSHLSGSICPKCASNYKPTTEEFIKKANLIHDYKYSYDNVVYNGVYNKVYITCPKHGNFIQTPNSHLSGCGCPKCNTKGQTDLFYKLKTCFKTEEILFEVGNSIVPWIGKQRLDIYFPKYNIAIEYDGQQHFRPIHFFGGQNVFEKCIGLDLQKNIKCKENNCHLLRIKYNYSNSDFENLITQIKEIIYEFNH